MRGDWSKVFQANSANPGEVSTFRLYVLRVVYVVTFLFVGTNAWNGMLTYIGAWDPLQGVAFSFWAAYATLMILGWRYPLKLLPLLLLQFFYKLVWLFAVAYPLWSSGQLSGSSASGLATIFLMAVVVDLAAIPWPYALRSYVLKDARD